MGVTMKRISDYIFSDSWQLDVGGIEPNKRYVVLLDVGHLKKESS